MKTPKRKYRFYESGINPENGDLIMAAVTPELYEARWKRKNKIAQLKRSLHRYRDATNLPFYCHELHAYKLLQELKKPGKKATTNEWNSYIHRLQNIIYHMEQACISASISVGRCMERQVQKEEARRACNAKNAENANQTILTCTDAEQLTRGKGN